MLDVNEDYTSQLYNKPFDGGTTFKKLSKVYKTDGKHRRSIYGILTLFEEGKRIYVNRDVNAALNMLYLLKYYLKYQKRPIAFMRKK